MFGPPAYSEPPEYYEDDLASERELTRIKDEILNWTAKEYFEEFGGKECLSWSIQDCIDNDILDEVLMWEFAKFYIEYRREAGSDDELVKLEVLDWGLRTYLLEAGGEDCLDENVQWLVDNGLVDVEDIEDSANFVLDLLSEKTSEDDPPWIENSHIYWTRREEYA